MHVHHLNCGTCCPAGGALMDGRSTGPLARLVCHCLLLETNDGLVLVDTGYGLQDVRDPHPRLTRTWRAILNFRLREEECAIRQVEALGYKASDVRHIVLSHLDFDHAGGLEDFPGARVHVMSAEFRAASGPRRTLTTRNRYRPPQFDEVTQWRTYDGPSGEPWFGFQAVRQLEGLPPEILMVPLPGHTWGHAGVAVQADNGWLFYAADAYFYRHEVRRPDAKVTPMLGGYQTLMEVDRERRLANQARVRKLSIERRDQVRVFCAHDATEFDRAVAGTLL